MTYFIKQAELEDAQGNHQESDDLLKLQRLIDYTPKDWSEKGGNSFGPLKPEIDDFNLKLNEILNNIQLINDKLINKRNIVELKFNELDIQLNNTKQKHNLAEKKIYYILKKLEKQKITFIDFIMHHNDKFQIYKPIFEERISLMSIIQKQTEQLKPFEEKIEYYDKQQKALEVLKAYINFNKDQAIEKAIKAYIYAIQKVHQEYSQKFASSQNLYREIGLGRRGLLNINTLAENHFEVINTWRDTFLRKIFEEFFAAVNKKIKAAGFKNKELGFKRPSIREQRIKPKTTIKTQSETPSDVSVLMPQPAESDPIAA